MAKELLESLMALHGAALEQILDLTSKPAKPASLSSGNLAAINWSAACCCSMACIPEMQTRVTTALEKSRGFLDSHSAKAELVSISDDGAVTLRLALKPGGCGSTAATVKSTLRSGHSGRSSGCCLDPGGRSR